MNIFIIRHGESQGNINKKIYKELPDRLIALTDKGIKQARETGVYLKENFNIHSSNTFFFSSSHKRAVQTSENINLFLNCPIFIDDRIVEHNHGLFEGLSKKERFRLYPLEAERFYTQKKLRNEYFTPPPMGESPSDVALRFRSFWLEVSKSFNDLTKNIIIVAHGMTNLVIWKELMDHSVDWYSEQDELSNCSIIYLKLHKSNYILEDYAQIYAP